ncbi:UPF0665 family protein c [Sphaerosporella brunnea]|uniref:UPF0665 family protein c n=1 Tax=Sphaerosporella brunnea TaxID=1250544 RepID=A0A5J5EX47_9PEZI|nr:UPF0665 family protein c [Sphaerosporella brunnea]
MQYIRFLKKPRFKAGARRGGTVSTLIVVTSDLGESFMPRDSPIVGTVRHIDGTVIARREYTWAAGMRCLAIDISVGAQASNGKAIVLQVSAHERPADQLCSPVELPRSTVLSAWSAPFNPGKNEVEAGDFVERRMDIGREKYLGVWEETKDSIALHIWDAGVALVTYLSEVLSPTGEPSGSLDTLDKLLQSNRRLNVLELGSGCGIVGLTLAQLHSRCQVTLSDLPLAADISNKNINGHPQVAFRELDWNEDIPEDISSQYFDAVIVSDCMYNVDAAPALVSVIAKLFQKSPETVLVVGHKRRHESENQFLHLLEQSGIVLTDRTHMDTQGEEEAEGYAEDVNVVDLYTMRSATVGE